MQLDVQWFISALLANSLISLEDGRALNAELGGEPDLGTFAQEYLNRLTADMPEEEAQSYMENMQQLLEYAANQAASGEPPIESAALLSPVPEAPAPAEPVREAVSPQAAADTAEEEDEGPDKDPSEWIFSPEAPHDNIQYFFDMVEQVGSMGRQETAEFMQHFLLALREYGASDLHISANSPLFIRKNLDLFRPHAEYVIPAEDAKKMNYALLSKERRKQFEEEQDLNFALQIHTSRYRVALMQHRDGVGASYRIVPDKIRTLEELGFLPDDAKTLERLLDYHNGLILVTGPIGSGKTTTLAALVEIANKKREDHIITVEDPIEIVIESEGCKVTQRQIGAHTNSYRTALKGALREDPDIIVIGEMHDLETIENAITAAETGHLVIGTLPTCDAANTLNRILDVFPPNQQAQIRAMTAGSLRGVVCQKLIHNAQGGLAICYEILMNTMAVSNVISEGKIFQLRASMQIGSKSGMCTIDQNLLALFKANVITYETALGMIRDQSIVTQLQQEQAKRVATAGKKKK